MVFSVKWYILMDWENNKLVNIILEINDYINILGNLA